MCALRDRTARTPEYPDCQQSEGRTGCSADHQCSLLGIEELDPYALRKLVKAIYVDAPVKVNGKRTQHIHIQYDGIGFISPDELLKEETA